MHVLHVETGRRLYGGARQVAYLTAGLAEQGVSTTLVCPPDAAIASAAGGRVITLPSRGDLDVGFAGRLGRVIREQKPDLVHVHSRRGADLWGGVAAKRAGVPAILSRRVDNPEPFGLRQIKYRLYDRIIAISGGIRDVLISQAVPAGRVNLVHSAIDAASCELRWSRDEFAGAFDLPADALTVGVVAQLIPRKGHDVLLKAWGSILADCPRAVLLIFGRGPLEDTLRQAVARHGLEPSVRFAGFRDDLRQYLGHLDLLAHPARREGLGICLLEAQAAGVPIVGTSVGGIPEAVRDYESAFLVPPDDADSLARGVSAMLRDPQRREVMGDAGRAHVARQFSVPAMVSGNLAVYEQVLAGKRRG